MSKEDLRTEYLPSLGGNTTVLLDDRQVMRLPLDQLMNIGQNGVKVDCSIVGEDFDAADTDAWELRKFSRFVIASGHESAFSMAAGILLNPDFPLDGPAEDFREAGKNLFALAHELSGDQAIVFASEQFMDDPTDGYGITIMAGSEHDPSVVGLVLDEYADVKVLKLNEQVLSDISDGAYADSLVGWLGIEQNGLVTIAGPNAILEDNGASQPERFPLIAVTSRELCPPILREESVVITALRGAIRSIRNAQSHEMPEPIAAPDADTTEDGETLTPEKFLYPKGRPEPEYDDGDEKQNGGGSFHVDTHGIVGAIIRSQQASDRSGRPR